ncbi:MAG: pseudouridine synthase [Acidobacteriota bacterium]|nr:pseudouridine synthase [Acidobacteriota bacterium]
MGDRRGSREARLTGQRLQKLLSRAGICSRRAAEELIRQGRVTVNGEPAGLGARADPATDAVKVDGRRVRLVHPKHYYLLNKPRGAVSTKSDPQGRRTVLDFVPPKLHKLLFPVGRLDFDTEGLIVLTNDGDFAERIAHPRHGCPKLYEVKVRGIPDLKALERLRRGIVVRGRRTHSCEIRRRSVVSTRKDAPVNSWWTVKLTEGRSRQIREMFQRVGHPVQRLRRVAIGGVRDPKLRPGSCRELNATEIQRLRRG